MGKIKTVDDWNLKMQEIKQRTRAFEDYFNTFFKALELPAGTALKAVPRGDSCKGCYFSRKGTGDCLKIFLPCQGEYRKDGQDIMFKKVKIND